MARSTYIYVVSYADRVGAGAPILARTVKYELVRAMRHFPPAMLADVEVWRYVDEGAAYGGPASRAFLGTGPEFLAAEGVTVEFAPLREPRTWPKLADEAASDLPDVVDVIGDGRWYRLTEHGAEHLYAQRGHEGGWRLSLDGLRHLGDVREVLDDGQ